MPPDPKPPKPEIPSPWEFQKLAEASRDAANAAFADIRSRDAAYAAGDKNVDFTFMAVTVAFLYLRSVELALKGAILERELALPAAIPSPKLGHDIAALMACATKGEAHGPAPFTLSELGLDASGMDFLDRYSNDYSQKWLEYHFGPFHYPNLDQCQLVAIAVVGAVALIAKTLPSDDVCPRLEDQIEKSECPEDVDARLAPKMEYLGERINRVFAYFFFVHEYRGDRDQGADPSRNDRAWSIQTIGNACIDTTLLALRDLDDFLSDRPKVTKRKKKGESDDMRASDFGYPKSHTFLHSESEREMINKLIAHTTTVGAESLGFRWDILELASKGVAQCVEFLKSVEKKYGLSHFNLCTSARAIRSRTEAILAFIVREAEKQQGKSSNGE